MNIEESKSSICHHIYNALKCTRAHGDISYLKYDQALADDTGREVVHVGYKGGYKFDIDVTADSGIALIHDILKYI